MRDTKIDALEIFLLFAGADPRMDSRTHIDLDLMTVSFCPMLSFLA